MTFQFFPLQVHGHRLGTPWGTRLLLLAMVLLSLPACFELVDPTPLYLSLVEPRPHQLVTSLLVHPYLPYLVVNLVFVHLVGSLVEGAVGTRAFLVLGAAIGLAASGGPLLLVDPALLPESELFDGTMFPGASGLILGLLAAGVLLEPTAEVTLMAKQVLRSGSVITLELPVVAVAVLLVQVGFALVDPDPASVTTGYLPAVAAGLVLAMLGLRLGWLDCDGWDWLSQRRKRRAEAAGGELDEPGPRPTSCPRCSAALPEGAALCPVCGMQVS